ncbi:MAG: hypothetical protein IJ354_00095 [Clostridia bacterium]|nr:hypothetical protein [Clostridia bacterium]
MKKWLCLILAGLLLCSSACALTFDELQIPKSVTFRLDGTDVTVPVTVPDFTAAPAMYIQTMPVDQEKLAAVFGDAVQRDTGMGRIHLLLPDDGTDDNIHAMFEKTMQKLNLPWDFAVHKTIIGQNWPRLNCAVLANGIPVCNGAGMGNYMWFSRQEDGWELSMSYMDVPADKAWEIDFVPFEEITGWIQQRMDDDKLKAVDGIELWYGKQKKNGATVITPIWRVFGYDTQYHKWHKGDMPDAELRYRRCPPRDFSIPLDASTGDILKSTK